MAAVAATESIRPRLVDICGQHKTTKTTDQARAIKGGILRPLVNAKMITEAINAERKTEGCGPTTSTYPSKAKSDTAVRVARAIDNLFKSNITPPRTMAQLAPETAVKWLSERT
jgi:hypothetical protein